MKGGRAGTGAAMWFKREWARPFDWLLFVHMLLSVAMMFMLLQLHATACGMYVSDVEHGLRHQRAWAIRDADGLGYKYCKQAARLEIWP